MWLGLNGESRRIGGFLNSGGGIRTRDLRVMSPTSYLTAPPRGGQKMLAPDLATMKIGGVMSQYMLLVYEEEVDSAEQAEREHVTPALVELHASLREAGLLVGVQRLHSTESATSVRVRDGETEIVDGPFAVTKEVLAGYYVLECADLDEALKQAARMPMARWATIEVRPIMPAERWLDTARRAGVELSDEDVENLA